MRLWSRPSAVCRTRRRDEAGQEKVLDQRTPAWGGLWFGAAKESCLVPTCARCTGLGACNPHPSLHRCPQGTQLSHRAKLTDGFWMLFAISSAHPLGCPLHTPLHTSFTVAQASQQTAGGQGQRAYLCLAAHTKANIPPPFPKKERGMSKVAN